LAMRFCAVSARSRAVAPVRQSGEMLMRLRSWGG
jgi:hypothetical protein